MILIIPLKNYDTSPFGTLANYLQKFESLICIRKRYRAFSRPDNFTMDSKRLTMNGRQYTASMCAFSHAKHCKHIYDHRDADIGRYDAFAHIEAH